MAALHPSTTRMSETVSATELHHSMGHYCGRSLGDEVAAQRGSPGRARLAARRNCVVLRLAPGSR